MAVFSLKNSKVWKVENQNGFTKLNLGDSTKKKDGTWENFTWYGVTLMGNAKDFQVKEGDKVNVEGIIKQTKSEKDGKYYTNVIIFGICLSDDAKTDAPKKSNKVKMADVNANLPVKEEEPNFDDDTDLDSEFPFNLASGTSKTKKDTKFIETNPNPYYDSYDVDFDCND